MNEVDSSDAVDTQLGAESFWFATGRRKFHLIALWLGHESPSTTHMYIEADLAMKERALDRLKQPEVKTARYRPPKALMQFLQAL